MASAAELALVLLGKDEGAKALFQGVRGEAEKTESAFSKAFKVGSAVGVTALGALGAASLKFGGDFDSAFDTIRVGTGATGEDLDALKGSFKEVFGSVPTDMGAASTAIADINTRLGLTGEPLETVTKQFLELTRLTGGDLQKNIEEGAQSFQAWEIATEDQSAALDHIFKVSQSTGASFDTLAGLATKNSAALKGMGFTYEESIVLLGQFEKSGVNTEQAMTALNFATAKFAKDGVPFRDGLNDVVQKMAELGPGSEATALAIETFGRKTGIEMADMIARGQFSYEELMTTIGDSEETILGVASETNDMAEKWMMFKNRVLVTMEPMFSKLFGTMSAGMPILAGMAPVVSALGPAAALVGPQFTKMAGMAVPALRSIGLAMLTPPMGFVVILTAAAVAAYVFRDDIIGAFGAMADWVVPKVEWVGEKVTGAFQAILDFGKENWPEIASILLLPFTGPLIFLATDAFGVRSALIGAFTDVKDFIGGVWGGIADQAAAGWGVIWSVIRANVNLIIDLINGLIRAWNSLEFSMSDPTGVLGFMGLPDSISVGTPDLPLVPRLKTGHPFIPFDNFPALLHRGERVLTAEENATYHQNNSRRSVHFYGPVYFNNGSGNGMQSSELLLMRP